MNPVKYAEEVLDVHGPWSEIQHRINSHFEYTEMLDEKQRTLT